jgi:hypothetical protein
MFWDEMAAFGDDQAAGHDRERVRTHKEAKNNNAARN